MNEIKKIVPDAIKFLEKSSEIIGRFESESFSIDTWNEFHDLGINSPIEQLFYTAFKCVAKTNFYPPLELISSDTLYGMGIQPQFHIGKFRVDFLASYHISKDKFFEAVVECDSQQFHDRSEQERRYEKQRDRFVQAQGFRTFHFTGKEIKDNPYKCAAEVIAYLTKSKIEDILDPNFYEEEE